jgi:hypothetical protein
MFAIGPNSNKSAKRLHVEPAHPYEPVAFFSPVAHKSAQGSTTEHRTLPTERGSKVVQFNFVGDAIGIRKTGKKKNRSVNALPGVLTKDGKITRPPAAGTYTVVAKTDQLQPLKLIMVEFARAASRLTGQPLPDFARISTVSLPPPKLPARPAYYVHRLYPDLGYYPPPGHV